MAVLEDLEISCNHVPTPRSCPSVGKVENVIFGYNIPSGIKTGRDCL